MWLELPELDIGQPEEIANHRWSPFGDGESKNLFRKKLPLLAWNLARLIPFTRKKALSQTFRIRQRNEMAAGDLLYVLSKSFTRNSPLKFDREKAIVSSRQNMNWYCWPALKAAGLTEDDVGFLAWFFRTGAQYVWRHVVQKVCWHIKCRRIAAAQRGLFPRLYPHWIMAAGAALVALGLIGLALRQKRDVEFDHEQTEMKANGKRDGPDANATTPPPWPRRPPPQAR
jgi:hypothetical protein